MPKLEIYFEDFVHLSSIKPNLKYHLMDPRLNAQYAILPVKFAFSDLASYTCKKKKNMFEKENIRLVHLEKVAEELLSHFEGNRIFAFYGGMGAGKTTFIQAICRLLGSEDNITSPSFAIINEYTTSFNQIIYHFDFYRIKNPEEAFDLGYEDYFYSGNYCLIEWPGKIKYLLPGHHVEVTIETTGEDVRTIRAKLAG